MSKEQPITINQLYFRIEKLQDNLMVLNNITKVLLKSLDPNDANQVKAIKKASKLMEKITFTKEGV